MSIIGILRWWYGAGLVWRAGRLADRLAAMADYFSFATLITTWFAPFRQISAGPVRGPIGIQIRAWGDRLVSRVIGAIMRTILMLVGVVAMLGLAALSLVWLVVWLVTPWLPVVGLGLALTGVGR